MNGAGHGEDRRFHDRLNLRLTVLLYRNPGAPPVAAKTTNMSSGGFYILSPEPFTPSERLKAHVFLPRLERFRTNWTSLIECEVEVVHVSLGGKTGFGVGCRIHNYAFRRESIVRGTEALESLEL